MNRQSLRRMTMLIVAAATAVALVACGDSEPPAPQWDGRSVQATADNLPFVPTIINSSLGVGNARVVVALIHREDGALISGATIHATFYRLATDPEAEPLVAEEVAAGPLVARVLDLDAGNDGHASRLGVGSAVDRSMHAVAYVEPGQDGARTPPSHDDGVTTVYTTNVEFNRSGHWGIALEVEEGGETSRVQMRFLVLDGTPEPPLGASAPRSEQLTLRDVEDIAQVSSAVSPNPAMLDLTVAEALDAGKPVVVAFVTPAFCQTRYCGPVMEAVVEPAWEQYGDRVAFVHIEPFNLQVARTQGQLEPVPTVLEWGLRTEPYIFVVDADGLIRHKIEGVTDLAELSEAIEDVLE